MQDNCVACNHMEMRLIGQYNAQGVEGVSRDPWIAQNFVNYTFTVKRELLQLWIVI